MSKTLLEKRWQGIIIVALSPGSINTADPDGRIAHALDPKRNALRHLNRSHFHIGTIKKRYTCVFTYHFRYSLLPTIETPFGFESFAVLSEWYHGSSITDRCRAPDENPVKICLQICPFMNARSSSRSGICREKQ